MKPAAHSIHPDVANVLEKFLPELKAALAKTYQGGDYSYSVQVEGQVVASLNTKADVSPVAWPDDTVEEETAKRVVKKAPDSEAAASE